MSNISLTEYLPYIYKTISKYINLTNNEKKIIAKNVAKLKNTTKYSDIEFINAFIDIYIDSKNTNIDAITNPDIQQINEQTNNINIQSDGGQRGNIPLLNIASIFGMSDVRSIQYAFNPEALHIKNYIILDSKYRIIEGKNTDTTSKFKFIFNSHGQYGTGVVSSVGLIRDIVSMRVYQPRVPYIVEYLYTESSRVSLLIEEFSSQAYVAESGKKFHFMFYVHNNADPIYADEYQMIELYSDYGTKGIFNFHKPMTTFASLTLIWGDPINVIPFRHDRDTCTFTYGATTTIVPTNPHLFYFPGFTFITITGFNTLAPVADANIITAMNNENDLTATVSNDTNMTVSINTSTITPIVGLTCAIYYAERRIVVPIELTHLRSV